MKTSSQNQETILDLRETLNQGGHPLNQILAAAKEVQGDDCLCLVTPFEPVPLYSVLQQYDLICTSTEVTHNHWETRITKNKNISEKSTPEQAASPSETSEKSLEVASPEQTPVHIDTRSLEPPEPMVQILTLLEKLPIKSTLHALTDRNPLHLLAALEERGFASSCNPCADGSGWLTVIYK